MIHLLVILSVVFSGSAVAQMSELYKRDGTSGTVYGTSPDSIEEYLERRRTTGTGIHTLESGTWQPYLNTPNSSTMLNMPMSSTPAGNTPMGMPQSAPEIQQMTPAHPFGSALVPAPGGR